MSGRFVLLGVASMRSAWFSDLTRWSTSGLVSVDYTKAISLEEVRAILGTGRKISAVLVDSNAHGLDREFVAVAKRLGCIVVVVEQTTPSRDWESIGVATTLPAGFSPEDLTGVLQRHATRIDASIRRSAELSVDIKGDEDLAPLIAVTGAGGSGVSTIAIAIAQGLAEGDRAKSIALADLTRTADLAMYHDVGDVIPGFPELVELHRGDTPDPTAIRDLLFAIDARSYFLLLGQRRSRDSAAMGPLSTAAAIDGLRRSFDFVVVDVDPTIDGEAETGSLDIELFNTAQRHALGSASLIMTVTQPGMRGIRRLSMLLDALGRLDCDAHHIIPVFNHMTRGAASRSAITRLTADLNPMAEPTHPPLFTRHYRTMEDIHHSATPMPAQLIAQLAIPILTALDTPRQAKRASAGRRVAPLRDASESRVA